MSTNPNKLASKHTPGPWTAEHMDEGCWISGVDRDEPVICDITARLMVYDEQTKQHEECLQDEDIANAHLISAAPEAMEFIADLMPIFELINERNLFNKRDIDKLILGAEAILKKGYNY